MITCYVAAGKKKGLKMCTLFAEGARRHGVDARVVEDDDPTYRGGDVFVYGWTAPTVAMMRAASEAGASYYYADNAYHFGRGEYFRITRNRLMHDGLGTHDPARWRAFQIRIKPWRVKGEHVVIATQSEAFYLERHGITRLRWVANVVEQIKATHARRTVYVCHKPPAGESGNAPTAIDFESKLDNAWAMVTHSSSAAVKAVIEGVPVFSHPESMAASIGRTDVADIERPVLPDWREQWLANLAANQWTWNEIERGNAWRALHNVRLAA